MNNVVIFKIGNQVEIRGIFITKIENKKGKWKAQAKLAQEFHHVEIRDIFNNQ